MKSNIKTVFPSQLRLSSINASYKKWHTSVAVFSSSNNYVSLLGSCNGPPRSCGDVLPNISCNIRPWLLQCESELGSILDRELNVAWVARQNFYGEIPQKGLDTDLTRPIPLLR